MHYSDRDAHVQGFSTKPNHSPKPVQLSWFSRMFRRLDRFVDWLFF